MTNGTEAVTAPVDFGELKGFALMAKVEAESANEVLKERKAELDEKIEIIRKGWFAKNAEAIRDAEEAQEKAIVADKALRDAMLAEFDQTGEKQLYPGLSIAVNHEYNYDEKKAVQFCIERKMLELLAVKHVAFVAQMKVTPQDFCSIREKPTARVSFKEVKETE